MNMESINFAPLANTNNFLEIDFERQLKQLDDILKNHNKHGEDGFYQSILCFIAESISAFKAVLFIYHTQKRVLQLKSTYGLLRQQVKSPQIEAGEGLLGQVVTKQEHIHFSKLNTSKESIDFSSIKVSISDVFILPLVFNGQTYGVIEFSFFAPVPENIVHYLNTAAKNIAASLEGFLNAQIAIELSNQTQEKQEAIFVQEELKSTLKELEITHNLLEKKNQELDDAFSKFKADNLRLLASIKYAQKMQKAILPSLKKLKKVFKDCFLVYKPKDTVSGDFYWYGEVQDYQYLAVIDCTGHGVPGAFMSMIGNTLLNQIIIEKKITSPSEILNQLYGKVNEALSQNTSNNQDGMNLVLCRLKKEGKSYELTFSGAKSNLYLVFHKKLYQIKGDRKSIGGFQLDPGFSFTEQKTHIPPGCILYLMTDGWEDTCNIHRVSYGRKRLENSLRSVINHPLKAQKELLWKDLLAFKGDTEQRDDITLLSIQV